MTLNIDISIANRNALLTNRVKCQIYIRLVESEIIQNVEMDSWLETTDHETFFDILIRLWREAELQIPQHDAIIAAIRKKLNLNISTQRADSGFTFMASYWKSCWISEKTQMNISTKLIHEVWLTTLMIG